MRSARTDAFRRWQDTARITWPASTFTSYTRYTTLAEEIEAEVNEKTAFVLLEQGRGLTTWRARYKKGEVSEAVPYGYVSARPGWTLEFSEDQAESAPAKFVRRLVLRAFGFDVIHVLRQKARFKSADVIWTHTEHMHLAYSLVSLFSRSLPPAICQSVWLPELISDGRGFKMLLARLLIRRGAVNVVQSLGNAALLKKTAPEVQCIYVPFGISSEPFSALAMSSPPNARRLRVLAVGNDRHRDWLTLIDAVDGLTDIAEMRILSRSAMPRELPENVEVKSARGLAAIQDSYAWADVVCLPLRQNSHASGITVALEAIYSSTPLIMTNVGGLGDYLPSLVPYSLQPNAHPGEWRARLIEMTEGYEALAADMRAAGSRDASALDLTSEGYSRRLLEVSETVLAAVHPPHNRRTRHSTLGRPNSSSSSTNIV
jgi:glycosyltransferase involved in cell wall biosynthesis